MINIRTIYFKYNLFTYYMYMILVTFQTKTCSFFTFRIRIINFKLNVVLKTSRRWEHNANNCPSCQCDGVTRICNDHRDCCLQKMHQVCKFCFIISFLSPIFYCFTFDTLYCSIHLRLVSMELSNVFLKKSNILCVLTVSQHFGG